MSIWKNFSLMYFSLYLGSYFKFKIQNMKKNINRAFTLVELIVVITILAVLATVAFISFQGYTSSSRDSVRLADLKNISKSFEINRTKGISFPLPDKKVDISASGTVFQYQGELSQNTLQSDLNIFDGGLDPITKKPYWYAVNSARNKFQIIWFLENQEYITNISNNTTFADNSDKYIKSSGDSLGILLSVDKNEVIVQSGSLNEIDIESNTQNYWVIIDNKINIWDNDYLKNNLSFRINEIESCRSILLNGNSNWDGKYIINPTWVNWEEYEVYCDMSTDWWGWTVILSDSLSVAVFSHSIWDQLSNTTESIPDVTLNSKNARIVWNWPKYNEIRLQSKYSNGFKGNTRINNTWIFWHISCDLLSFVISHENNSIDYQNGKCRDEMFDYWQDSDTRDYYSGYNVFWQYSNTYYYYWQRNYLWKILKSTLFITKNWDTNYGWIDSVDHSCWASWSNDSCRMAEDIIVQHENTIKRAIFSIR